MPPDTPKVTCRGDDGHASIGGVQRLIDWYRIASSTWAVVALVIANAIPLGGILFLGWSVWTILILYWLENGVIGLFNVLKMVRAEGPSIEGSARWRVNGRPADQLTRAQMIPFFTLHYGLFWLVHGVFVLTLPATAGIAGGVDMARGVNPLTILVAVVALSISHAVSYRLNFIGQEEYRRVSPAAQMFKPYGRLLILHITVIFGALAIGLTGAPAAAVAILVGPKTALDLVIHLAAHGRAGGSGVRAAIG